MDNVRTLPTALPGCLSRTAADGLAERETHQLERGEVEIRCVVDVDPNYTASVIDIYDDVFQDFARICRGTIDEVDVERIGGRVVGKLHLSPRAWAKIAERRAQ